MPPKSYRPLPSGFSLTSFRFYTTGGAERRDQFFRRRAHQRGIAERKAMIDRGHDLPITQQAQVLRISRGSVYYLPRPVPEADLALMRRLDRLHLEYPFAGSRMLQGLLAAEGCRSGRRHVKTLMQRMGIEALYRRPRTTKPEPGHKIYPYLLRGLSIERPNQVWAMDITYIPMAHGFVLSGRGARLVQPARAVVAAVDHDGGGVLRCNAGGCFGASRHAG